MLERATERFRLSVREVDIDGDPGLASEYGEKVPVVVAGGGYFGRLVAPIDEPELLRYLAMVEEKEAKAAEVVVGPPDFWLDRAVSFVGRRWLAFVNWGLGIFVGLPWLAAIFASLGIWSLADPIYTLYMIQCHQLPERAPTVFGYEVAQCIRCSALYGGMLLWGLVFGLARDRKLPRLGWILKPLPWYLFLLFLVPILVDGILHMSGVRAPGDFNAEVGFGQFEVGAQAFGLNWWLRVATGLIAGLGAVWFAYPRMARSVRDSEELRQAYRVAAQRRYAQAAGATDA
jgi:uncharacterized membrane protein